MCSGPRKPCPPPSQLDSSLLLELAASDDLAGFRRAVEEHGHSISAAALWYGRSSAEGGRFMAIEQRTPLMIAAAYGSTGIVSYVLSTVPSEARRASATDGATALHLAAAGGAASSFEVTKLLIAAEADVDVYDASGHRAGDLIPRQLPCSIDKSLRLVLKAVSSPPSSPPKKSSPREEPKKEYPPDLTLPDIKTGIYSTDEFRMYAFKIKPCSRAYSHDWTECPFVHPGENARRRDPRKYFYSCVPCPDFRKGTCRKADTCEYAHGVFECWLHPAQYRTRLCKDEVGCKRRICFFAHKPEELRTVNPSAMSVGSIGSPRADMATAAALLMMQQPSSPISSPISSSPLQSRLKTPLTPRDLDLDLELLGLDQYAQKLFDKVPNAPSPRSNWGGAVGNVSSPLDPFGSVDASLLSQLQAMSLKQTGPDSDLHPTQFFSSYESNLPSPITSQGTGLGLDHSMAKAIMNSRASAFAKRSQSFCDRRAAPAVRPSSTLSVMTSAATSAAVTPSVLSDWASPDGKLNWGIQGEELHKLRKSASFGFRSNQTTPIKNPTGSMDQPDLTWGAHGSGIYNSDPFSPWAEQEPMVA